MNCLYDVIQLPIDWLIDWLINMCYLVRGYIFSSLHLCRIMWVQLRLNKINKRYVHFVYLQTWMCWQTHQFIRHTCTNYLLILQQSDFGNTFDPPAIEVEQTHQFTPTLYIIRVICDRVRVLLLRTRHFCLRVIKRNNTGNAHLSFRGKGALCFILFIIY